MITIIQLPQSFQIVASRSAVRAGIDMIPLLIFSALGSGLGGALCSRKPIERELLAFSFMLQLIGLGLLYSVRLGGAALASHYVYESLAGLGFGLSLSSITIVARRSVDEDDLSVAMGLTTQLRVLGGLIGIGAAQSLLNRVTGQDLKSYVSAEVRARLQSSVENIHTLSKEQQDTVRRFYGRGYRQQIIVSLSTAALGLVLALTMAATREATVEKETPDETPSEDSELQRLPPLEPYQIDRVGHVSDPSQKP
jgi:Na+/glutamate symporter